MSDYLTEAAETIGSLVSDEGQQDHRLLLIYALLLRVKGSSVSAADVHDAWSTWRLLIGQPHPHILPFADLRPDTQALDEPFAAAIRVAHRVLTCAPDSREGDAAQLGAPDIGRG
jgi:hypothetical protein